MRVKQVTTGGRIRWEIYAGTVNGRRRRYYAKTEKDANAKVKELENERAAVGKLWRALKPADKSELLNVLEEVENAGLTLRTVWQHYQQTKGANASQRVKIEAARTEFLRSKIEENKRPKYLEMLELTVERFGRPYPGWRVDEIRLEHVESFLRQFPQPITRQGEHRRLSVFFNWCVARGYCFGNPVARLKVPSVDYRRPKILTLAQCRTLLKSAQAHDRGQLLGKKDHKGNLLKVVKRKKRVKMTGEMLPGIVLMLFAGVRPAEIQRLTWKDVRLETAELIIDSAASKVRDIRITHLPANTVEWLKKAKDRKGKVALGRNYRRRFTEVRTHAEVPWSQDVLRHTAASFWYEKFGAVETSKNLGHSEKTLFRNYRAQVTKADAEAFFGIVPK